MAKTSVARRERTYDTFGFSTERFWAKIKTSALNGAYFRVLSLLSWKQQRFAVVLFTTDSRLSYSSSFGRDPNCEPAKASPRNPGQILLGYYSRLFNPRNFHLAHRLRDRRNSLSLFSLLCFPFRISWFSSPFPSHLGRLLFRAETKFEMNGKMRERWNVKECITSFSAARIGRRSGVDVIQWSLNLLGVSRLSDSRKMLSRRHEEYALKFLVLSTNGNKCSNANDITLLRYHCSKNLRLRGDDSLIRNCWR